MKNIIDKWHLVIKSKDSILLDSLLHEDVVFHSPVVWTPQEGKPITMMYLMAASESFAQDFVYTKKVIHGNHAVLEFKCKMDDIIVEGVDIITADEQHEKIKEFKVMVRPLQAVNKVHEKMMAMLAFMKK